MDDVVITERMLAAGRRIYVTADMEFESADEIVRRIFLAMVEAQSHPRLGGRSRDDS